MNIGFDFHGVLEKYPKKFMALMKSLKQDNFIFVISGPPLLQVLEELNSTGYNQVQHFDFVISVVDWLKENDVIMYQHANDSWYCDDEIWWSSKAKICKEHSIDILYDDKLEYNKTMEDTLFLHVQ